MSVLAPPPGAQGPGVLRGALVEALDLLLARRASGLLPGDRRASGLGDGTELAQIRPYQVGDDVRRLDAAASARTGQPHVRDHVPERALTTWVLLDVSASMAFGTGARLKSDVAAGVVEVVGRLAVRRAGRVALLTTGGPVTTLLPPRSGRRALVALRARGGGRGGAGRRAGRRARRRPAAARAPRARPGADRDRVRLPRGRLDAPAARARRAPRRARRRADRPARGRAARRGPARPRRPGDRRPAGGRQRRRRALRRAFAAAELARRDALKADLRRARARHVELSAADDDWLRALGKGLR